MLAKECTKYRQRVSLLADAVLTHVTAESNDSVLIAVAAARLLLHDEAGEYVRLAAGFKQLEQLGNEVSPRLIDPAGRSHDVYLALAIHLHFAAFLRHYESLPADVWGACEAAVPDMIKPIRVAEEYADVPPPAEGCALLLWQALCLYGQALLLGRDVDIELIDSIVHQAISQPGPDRSLHRQDDHRHEGLDAWTCRELIGLHALANLALGRRNTTWAKRVQEIASYHLEHTQPDSTPNQPWAHFAFLWSPNTASFADQQFHYVTEQGVSQVDPVAAMLLADAANVLSRFEE